MWREYLSGSMLHCRNVGTEREAQAQLRDTTSPPLYALAKGLKLYTWVQNWCATGPILPYQVRALVELVTNFSRLIATLLGVKLTQGSHFVAVCRTVDCYHS
jgi:hypothetical protein